jgi:hypothetical protein
MMIVGAPTGAVVGTGVVVVGAGVVVVGAAVVVVGAGVVVVGLSIVLVGAGVIVGVVVVLVVGAGVTVDVLVQAPAANKDTARTRTTSPFPMSKRFIFPPPPNKFLLHNETAVHD